jgi:uncharacterized protein YaaQ
MKMVMVIVPSNTAEEVLDALVNAGHTATYVESRGGMLRQSQYSLFIALKKEQLEDVMDIIKSNCRTQIQMDTRPEKEKGFLHRAPVTADVGGAIAFIWDIDRIETF